MTQAVEIAYRKKLCMLGMFGVGKTSLVRRLVHKVFDDRYLSTIGVQIYQKQISGLEKLPKPNSELRFIIWDLANIERFTPAIKSYFSGAAAAIVVCDLTRPESLDEKHIHLQSFLESNPTAKLIIAGNKTDLVSHGNNIEACMKLASRYDAPYMPTSAKTGENVESLFTNLGRHVLESQ